MIIHLIRHGQRATGVGNPGLSRLGAKQAASTGSAFRRRPISSIHTSPLRGTLETAQQIARKCALPSPIVNARLLERTNWGDLPGQSLAEFEAMWERSNGDRDWLPPVGDSSRGAGDRLRGALLEIAAHETRGEAIVVTHGGIIADLLLNLFPVAEIEAKNPTYLHLKHCSVTTLSCQGDHFELLSAGAVDHLRTTITG